MFSSLFLKCIITDVLHSSLKGALAEHGYSIHWIWMSFILQLLRILNFAISRIFNSEVDICQKKVGKSASAVKFNGKKCLNRK